MYPRNNASPPRIAVGAVVQISDGAVQSSGVSVAVRPNGGNETAGGGTISYGGSSNVVYYTPTQAETDYTDFVVVAYKSGCVPASVTIITTAESTAGKVSVGASQSFDNSGQTTALPTDAYTIVNSGTYGNEAIKAAIAALKDFDPANDVVARVTLVDTCTTNTDMRGTDNAVLASFWTTGMTESYRSAGATPTPIQALYEILQNLTEFAISGTVKTVKKLDGSTTAKTYTLDSATAPTSITETT